MLRPLRNLPRQIQTLFKKVMSQESENLFFFWFCPMLCCHEMLLKTISPCALVESDIWCAAFWPTSEKNRKNCRMLGGIVSRVVSILQLQPVWFLWGMGSTDNPTDRHRKRRQKRCCLPQESKPLDKDMHIDTWTGKLARNWSVPGLI